MDCRMLPDLGYNALICRYSEIATKGRNRIFFENRLVEALRRGLRGLGKVTVVRERGRIFFHPGDGRLVFAAEDLAEMRRVLPFVSGLSSASPGFLLEPRLEQIEAAVDRSFGQVYEATLTGLSAEQPVRYAMQARRSDKAFPLISSEIERHFAERLLACYPRLLVDLETPRLAVELEIRKDRAFLCYERIDGPGGLPPGTGGSVLALLSGGIDSPVACYLMMKRGCLVDYVTFHSEPYTPPELILKVGRLAGQLNRFQFGGRLAAVNLVEAQKAIRDTCESRYRTILYRRFMVRIAAVLARVYGAKALVTGDNIGQVASQTLSNLAVVSAAAPTMILRPLLAFDKKDTMVLARHLGTLAESEHSVPDSCTVFAPADPATSAKFYRVEAQEARLDVMGLIHACLDATVQVDLTTFERLPIRGLHEAVDKALAPPGRRPPATPAAAAVVLELPGDEG
jgi:thiamine biosynthesis protein ThiI